MGILSVLCKLVYRLQKSCFTFIYLLTAEWLVLKISKVTKGKTGSQLEKEIFFYEGHGLQTSVSDILFYKLILVK